MLKYYMISTLFVFSFYFLNAQNPGVLDASFNVGTGANESVNAVVTQSDGKVIIGGNFTQFNGVPRNRVVRLNQDGTVDNSFDIGSGFNNVVRSLALQSNGKILVGGGFTTVNGIAIQRIARLNIDGSLDLTFNNSEGTINSTLVGGGAVSAIAIQNDGKIIVGGVSGYTNSQSYAGIARLDDSGVVETPVFNNVNLVGVNAIAIQNDGKIIVAGTRNDFTAITKIARFNPDGSLDNSFNAGTGATHDQTGTSSQSPAVLRSLAIDANGRIIIVGSFTMFNGFSCNRIARLNNDGSFDATLNSGSGAANLISDVEIQSNGKILIVGNFTSYNSNNCNYFTRLNSDGSFDDTYLIPGTNNAVNTIHIQPNGGIIIGGHFTTYNPNFSSVTPIRIARIFGDCVPPNAPAGLANQSFCSNATISDLSANGMNIQWYSSATGGTPLDATTLLVSGNSYYASQTETCESSTRLEVLVTITQPTTPTFTQLSNICSGGIINLPSTSNNSIAGTWSPAINNTTTTTYTFTPNSGQCASNQTMTVVVNQLPNVTLTAFNSLCDTAGIVTLTGGSPIGGIYTGTSVTNNAFNTAIGEGTYPITYSYTDVNGCSNTASQSLSVIDCGVAGILEIKDTFIVLYPNPASESLTIESPEINTGKLFEIHDLSGRLIFSGKLEAFKTQVIVSDFATGTYYLKIPELEKVIKFVKH